MVACLFRGIGNIAQLRVAVYVYFTVFLYPFLTKLDPCLVILHIKTNKQGYGSARKEHGNAVFVDSFCTN